MTDIFERYGLRRIVNASGTETTKGASPVSREVIDAVTELVLHNVDMAELQSAAAHVVGRTTGAECGCIVNCTAAGIAVAIAACMTGRDLARAEQLPDTEGMPDEVVLQRGHHVTYGGYVDQNVKLTGASVVEIGAATECGLYQLRHAITQRTAAALYVVSHHTVQSGLIDLASFVACCHERHVPVIVDAAAEPDPRLFLECGADVVIFSAHKPIAGITAGIVAGTKELVQACIYQEKGIGRPMKAGKEAVIGAMAALERWEALDRDAEQRALLERLSAAKSRLDELEGITTDFELDETSHLFHRLRIHVHPPAAGLTAFELSQALAGGDPAVMLRSLHADIGILLLDLRRADAATAQWIVTRIIEELTRNRAHGTAQSATPSWQDSPRLADRGEEALARWPLPLSSKT